METEETNKRSVVVLDVDGVINPYSNRKFYLRFVSSAMRNLAKVRGKRALLRAWPKMRKYGGPNSLFKFARLYCHDEKTFNEFTKNIIKDLDFNDIPYDNSTRAMIKRLNRYGDIIIRSDGLTAVAAAVWQRAMENRPADEIKRELLQHDVLPKQMTLQFEKRQIIVSGIEDNFMSTKTDIKSWARFARHYDIDLTKSVLIDDSRENNHTAEKLGMKTILIGKIDSLLQNTIFHDLKKRTLSDIIGSPISKALRHCKIAYGHKVDFAHLFSIITDIPKSELLTRLKRAKANKEKIESLKKQVNHADESVSTNKQTSQKSAAQHTLSPKDYSYFFFNTIV